MKLKNYSFIFLLLTSFLSANDLPPKPAYKQDLYTYHFWPMENNRFFNKFCIKNPTTRNLAWKLIKFLYCIRFNPTKKEFQNAQRAARHSRATDKDYKTLADYSFYATCFDIHEAKRIAYDLVQKFYGLYASVDQKDYMLVKELIKGFQDIINYEKEIRIICYKNKDYTIEKSLTLDMLKPDSLVKIMYQNSTYFYNKNKYYFDTLQEYLNGNEMWLETVNDRPYTYLLRNIRAIVGTNFMPEEIVQELQYWIKSLYEIKKIYRK